jgi:hypothetical protein
MLMFNNPSDQQPPDDFMREVGELAKKYGVNIQFHPMGNGVPNHGQTPHQMDQQHRFNNIECAGDAYADMIAKVYFDNVRSPHTSILGYTMGNIRNRIEMLLSTMGAIEAAPPGTSTMAFGAADIKSLLNQLAEQGGPKAIQLQKADEKACTLSKVAVYCLMALYPEIKGAMGGKSIKGGDLLLILEYMAHMIIPHIVTAWAQNPISNFEGDAFGAPIDEMFATLKDYHYDEASRCAAPKPNPEMFDNCDCKFCTHRRLRAKYAANKP